MRKFRYIISDVDGTITPLKVHVTPSEGVKKAITSLKKKNVVFSVATGKPFQLVEHLIEELKLESPIIVDNGAAIYDPVMKKPLWQSLMDKEKIEHTFLIAREYHKRIRISDGVMSFEVENNSQLKPATKFLLMNLTPLEADLFIQQVNNAFKDVAVSKAQSYEGDAFLDVYVTNMDATKQHAVVKFCEILGITSEEIMGIGDHYNDFPLLMACGFRVAMGNAVDELKEIADFIAPSVDEDGIVDVLEKFAGT